MAIFAKAATLVQKHAPELLVGGGIALMGIAGVMTAIKAPKAKYRFEAIKAERKESQPEKLEIVKQDVLWAVRNYWMPSAIFSAGAFAVCMAMHVSIKRTELMAGAYAAAHMTAENYRKKISETAGQKVLDKIDSEIARDEVESHPKPKAEEHIFSTGNGDTLCYDPLSGRYFRSSVEWVRKAEAAINQELAQQIEVTVNDFYDLLGLPTTQAGAYFGWNLETASVPRIVFASQLSDEEEPTLVIQYHPICLATFAQPILGE